MGRDETAALVFGPETSGLTNDELIVCGRAATIPSHSAQPSYNLSHAVAIAAYEVHRAGRRGHDEPPRRATHAEKEHLLELLRQGLGAIRALPEANAERCFADWRALVQRAELDRQGAEPARARGAQDGGRAAGRMMADEQTPFHDVIHLADGFSIPELKFRELVFVGALRPEGDAYVRDPDAAAPALPGAATCFPRACASVSAARTAASSSGPSVG